MNTKGDAYAEAGVDIDAGKRATDLMRVSIQKTYTDAVLSDTGAFGGLFSAIDLKSLSQPVLVASTDGVGTKTMVAAKMGRWDTIGQDLVNHCVNDILVQGAEPLFFLDYVASSKLNPEQIASVVTGCAVACQQVGAALLGGETAEMPGVYQDGELDLVGTIVGVVDLDQIVDGSQIEPGDQVIALPSTGLHTNGYSLARKVLAHINWSQPHSLLGESVGEALLKIHRCYRNDVRLVREAGVKIHGMAHITGGGVVENIPRILPDGLGVRIDRTTFDVPPIFRLVQSVGQIDDATMFRTFNMGMGFVIVVPEAYANAVLDVTDGVVVGSVVDDAEGVKIIDG